MLLYFFSNFKTNFYQLGSIFAINIKGEHIISYYFPEQLFQLMFLQVLDLQIAQSPLLGPGCGLG